MLTLAHIFAYNSKSVLLQRASFSHAGTHMIKPAGDKYSKVTFFPNSAYIPQIFVILANNIAKVVCLRVMFSD